ncbi:hypothetical protein T12_3277 [Trichinella patagoniensis]|uniref:Uncharacterized protein n=1 Tax=Trichinella patagoniensis TaxID=990121 RepID=A0A0V1AA80_9BILA|nr:hypothetical protein T12_3277 [Trichinella patagoniensis]
MEDLKLWLYYLQLVHQHHVSSPPMTELLAGTHGSNGVYHTENRYANSLLSLYEKVDQIYQKRRCCYTGCVSAAFLPCSWKDEQVPCICLDKAILLKVYISEGTSSTSAVQQMRQECSRKRNKSNAAIFVKYNRRDSRGINQRFYANVQHCQHCLPFCVENASDEYILHYGFDGFIDCRSIDYTGLKPAYHSMNRFIAAKRGLKALTSLTCTSSNYAHSVASQWSTPVYTFVHCVKLPLWRFVSKTSFTNCQLFHPIYTEYAFS